MDINWGGLQGRNLFADYATGAKYGDEMRQTQAKRKAVNLYATDPEGAERALIAAGEYETAEALRKRREAERSQKVKTDVGALVAAKDMTGARAAAAQGGEYDLATTISQMEKADREAADARASDIAGYSLWLKKNVPYPERRARMAADKERLLGLGYTEAQLASFDPTDANLDSNAGKAMDLKAALAQQNADRTFGEERRHNQATEAAAAGNLGVRRQEFIERKRQHGFGTPGVAPIRDEDVEIDP